MGFFCFVFFTLTFPKLQHQHTPLSFPYVVPSQSHQNHAVMKATVSTDSPISPGAELLPSMTLLLKKGWRAKQRMTPPKPPRWAQHVAAVLNRRPTNIPRTALRLQKQFNRNASVEFQGSMAFCLTASFKNTYTGKKPLWTQHKTDNGISGQAAVLSLDWTTDWKRLLNASDTQECSWEAGWAPALPALTALGNTGEL